MGKEGSRENGHLQNLVKNFGGRKSPSRDTLDHSVFEFVFLNLVCKVIMILPISLPPLFYSTIVWKIYPVWYNCTSCDSLLSPKSSCSPPPSLLLTVPLMSHCEIISQAYSEMLSVFKSRRIICILWCCRKFLKDLNYFLLLSFSYLNEKKYKKTKQNNHTLSHIPPFNFSSARLQFSRADFPNRVLPDYVGQMSCPLALSIL